MISIFLKGLNINMYLGNIYVLQYMFAIRAALLPSMLLFLFLKKICTFFIKDTTHVIFVFIGYFKWKTNTYR